MQHMLAEAIFTLAAVAAVIFTVGAVSAYVMEKQTNEAGPLILVAVTLWLVTFGLYQGLP